MTKIRIAFAALAIAMVGCVEEGPLKTEKADVLQLAYVPATSGMATALTSKGSLAVTSVSTDEVWAVVVRCRDHNKTFSLRGKEIYDQCKIGAVVTLEYVELIDKKTGFVEDYRTKRIIP